MTLLASLLTLGPGEQAGEAEQAVESGATQERSQAMDEGPHGAISGVVRDTDTDEGIDGALVVLRCRCDADGTDTMTDARGVYQFTELPESKYKLVVHHPAGETIRRVDVERDASYRVNFSVTARHMTEERMDQLRRAERMRKAGIGVLSAGGVLAVGSVLAVAISPCGHDGASGTNCSSDTRTIVGASFGLAAVATVGTGIGLLAASKRQRRNVYAAATGDEHGGMLVVGGRF